MAFGWDDLIYLGMTAYGSSQAGKAGKKSASGGKNALAEQQRQYNTNLTMLEPQRALGYGALSDIASLYGYALPGYTPLGAVNATGSAAPTGSSNWLMGSPVNVAGRKAPSTTAGLDNNPLSGGMRRFGATIDPAAGTVTVNAKKNQRDKDALATAYLRGEDVDLGGKFKRIRNAIDEMRAQGYQWTDAPPPQTAGPTGEAGNMSRFFASPDYEFRRSEGLRGIEQGAAARGGALSGNALRATTDFSSNLAAGEYGNYMNRLFNIAGMGQTATGGAVNAGTNYVNNASNLLQGIGDSRASGILGETNTWMNGANNLLNYRLMRDQQGGAPTYSQYGPWRDGYRGL